MFAELVTHFAGLELISSTLFFSAVILALLGRAPQGLVFGSYLFVFLTHVHNLL